MKTKITAKDIMIGDWVFCVDSTHENKIYAQIDAIEEGQTCILVRDGDCNWFLDICFIEAIPLTAEILEKIGFIKEEEPRGFSEPYCVYVNNDYQYPIKIYPKDIMDRYSRLIVGDDDDSEYMSLLINYIHELQHALRLAGITNIEFDKLINKCGGQ